MEVGSAHGHDAASIGMGGGGGSTERKGEHGGRGHPGGDLERDGWGRRPGVVHCELRAAMAAPREVWDATIPANMIVDVHQAYVLGK